MLQEFINQYGVEILGTLLTGVAGYVGICCKNLYAKYIDTKVKQDVVRTCVSAVEQIYIDIHGEEKKAVAIDYVQEVLAIKGIKVGDTELDILVESAVQEFNKQFGGNK